MAVVFQVGTPALSELSDGVTALILQIMKLCGPVMGHTIEKRQGKTGADLKPNDMCLADCM